MSDYHYNHLQQQLDRIEARLERVDQNVQDHIRGTEVAIDVLGKLPADMQPIRAHVAAWGVAGKILGLVGTVVGLGSFLAKLMGWI